MDDGSGGLTLPATSATAIGAGAGVIVTTNLADLPQDALAKYGIEAQHPDEFVMHLLDLAPNLVCSAAKKQRGSLKNPPLTVDQYVEWAGTNRLRSLAVRGIDLTKKRGRKKTR